MSANPYEDENYRSEVAREAKLGKLSENGRVLGVELALVDEPGLRAFAKTLSLKDDAGQPIKVDKLDLEHLVSEVTGRMIAESKRDPESYVTCDPGCHGISKGDEACVFCGRTEAEQPASDLHEVCALFPRLPDDELQALADDIAANGLHEPITMLGGLVLDGQNRKAACALAGVEPTFVEYGGDDPVGFVVSKNLARRQLDASQRALIAAKLANLGEGRHGNSANPAELISQPKAAAKLNVSTRQVGKAKALLDAGQPGLVKQVAAGQLSLDAASKKAAEAKPRAARTKRQLAHELSAVERKIKEAAKHAAIVGRILRGIHVDALYQIGAAKTGAIVPPIFAALHGEIARVLRLGCAPSGAAKKLSDVAAVDGTKRAKSARKAGK